MIDLTNKSNLSEYDEEIKTFLEDMYSLKLKHKEATKLLESCINSLEYVENLSHVVSGYAVRQELVDNIKIFLDRNK